mmetsp:Transcript_39316/g.128565  ORF Transcript_39316/g.128565 Transcript_39316/m.128565 type:complete len:122 (-) Transcript_39316:796-1161(-)
MPQSLQELVLEYGPLVLIVYVSISLAALCAICAALFAGMDAGPMLQHAGLSTAAAEGTLLVAAFALWKLLAPLKLLLTLCIVRRVAVRRGAEARRLADRTSLDSEAGSEERACRTACLPLV